MSAEELPLITTASEDVRPEGLTLASISRDGRRMLFVDALGREYTVPVDERLRAAVPQRAQQPARRSETPMSTTPALRPRDIQARIRSGESVDQVAAAAGVEAASIMAFAAPVIAEREHMATRAARASVRRSLPVGPNAPRTLQDAIEAQLSPYGVESESITWDSWRRTDGRWILLGLFETPDRAGTAELLYDIQGSYVAAENDDARWLLGDLLPEPEPAPMPVRDDLSSFRERRQSMPEIDVFAPTQPDLTDEPTIEVTVEAPVEPAVDEVEAPKAAAAVKRKRGSIPSWDEIMFGGPSA